MKNLAPSLLRIPFVRDVATMQVGRMFAIGCSFVSSIVYARLLGVGGYGEYAIVLAFAAMFGIMTNLGQQATALTFLSESYGRKDERGMRETLHYYFVTSILTMLVLGILVIFLPKISLLIYGADTVGKLAQIVFVSSILDPIFVFMLIVLQTVREIRMLTLMENGRVGVQLGLSIVFLLMGHGVAGILWGMLIGTAAFGVLGLASYPWLRRRHTLPSLAAIASTTGGTHLWKYAKDGIWIAIDKNVSNLYPSIFLFILSTRATPSVVGLIRLGFKLAGLPASVALASVSRLASSVIPTAAGRGWETLKEKVFILAKNTLLLHVGVTFAAMILVPLFLPFVYGEQFRVAVWPFLVITALHISLALHALITPILRLYSKIRLAAYLCIAGTTGGVLLFFVLTTFTQATWALYASLALYHLVNASVLFPTLRLLRTPLRPHADSSPQ